MATISDTPEYSIEDSITAASQEPPPLNTRVRSFLVQVAQQGVPITYRDLAKALQLSPPNTIHQITTALEYLMEEDAAAGHPLIAALVISKTRIDLPATGFFNCARRLERYAGPDDGPDARDFHTAAFNASIIFWGATTKFKNPV